MTNAQVEAARAGRDLISLLRDEEIGCSHECLCEQAAAEIARLRADRDQRCAELLAEIDRLTPYIDEVARLRARPTEEEIAMAIHRAFWLRQYGEETGTAEHTIKVTWQSASVREARIADARAVIAKFPKVQP
jgi:hypothetical protein